VRLRPEKLVASLRARPTSLSWRVELDFDRAVVEQHLDVKRWGAIQASRP